MARTSAAKCPSVGRASSGGPVRTSSRSMTGSRSARIRAAAFGLGLSVICDHPRPCRYCAAVTAVVLLSASSGRSKAPSRSPRAAGSAPSPGAGSPALPQRRVDRLRLGPGASARAPGDQYRHRRRSRSWTRGNPRSVVDVAQPIAIARQDRLAAGPRSMMNRALPSGCAYLHVERVRHRQIMWLRSRRGQDRIDRRSRARGQGRLSRCPRGRRSAMTRASAASFANPGAGAWANHARRGGPIPRRLGASSLGIQRLQRWSASSTA